MMVQSMIYLGNGIAVMGEDNGTAFLTTDHGTTWQSRHFDPEAWRNLSKNFGTEKPLSAEGNNLLHEILAETKIGGEAKIL